MKYLNVVCIGSNIETLQVLNSFYKNELKITALVTESFKKETKGSDYKNLKNFSITNNIPLIKTGKINSKTTKKKVKEYNPSYIFVLGWHELLDKEFISLANKCVIGSHPSNLPYGRGRAPVPWTIIEGLQQSAVTFFKINTRVDEGEIFLKKRFFIKRNIDSKHLYKIVGDKLSEGFVEIYKKLLKGKLNMKKQNTDLGTIRARRIFSDGLINFNDKVKNIEVLIKATTSPYPGAFTFYKNNILTIWNCVKEKNNKYKGVCGQILKKKKDSILVQCSDGLLWFLNMEMKGKICQISNFKLGDRLGFNSDYEIYNLKKQITKLEKKINGKLYKK